MHLGLVRLPGVTCKNISLQTLKIFTSLTQIYIFKLALVDFEVCVFLPWYFCQKHKNSLVPQSCVHQNFL